MNVRFQDKVLLLVTGISLSFLTNAQEKPAGSAQELADKLSNPVSGLISVPLQSNLDYGIGQYNGSKYTTNVQPVVPFNLSPKLNLITRYIVPIVDQRDISGENTNQFGLSDATVSGFFTPVEKKHGIIWAVGPAFSIPIGTSDLLSARKWGIGPTALLLKQSNGLTYGFLVNQIWSVAGAENRDEVNQMFLQPTFAKNFKSGAGLGLSSEINFNWQTGNTTADLIPTVSGVTRYGKQVVSMSIGPRIPLAAPASSRPDWGLRASLTFVFPK
jgi:hypothetical protein